MTFTCLQTGSGRWLSEGDAGTEALENGTQKLFCSQQGEVASSKGMVSFHT